MRKYFFAFFAFFFLTYSSAHSQWRRPKKVKDNHSSINSRKQGDVFPTTFNYKPNGWYFGPGLTYTLTDFTKETKQFGNPEYDVTFNPGGKAGAYLEGGRYRFIENSYIFRYLDYGLAYKWLRGKENFETNTQINGTGIFNDHFVTAHFNLNNVVPVGYGFIQNTIGLNADYGFIQTRKNSFGLGENNTGKFVGQLHYKLGYGWKPSEKLLMVFSVETPILNLYPFEVPKSRLPYFNSRYRPLIFTLRFIFLRPISDVCPPVYSPDMPRDFIPDGMHNE
jgi:hypothetical protein